MNRKMVPFTNKEKAEMHLIYGAADGNGAEAQRMYGERFPNRRLPNRKTFERLHRQLCETGSFLASRSNAGRAKKDESVVVAEAILDVVAAQPSTSTRTVARQVDTSQSMTWRVLKDEHLHPFHVQRVQKLSPGDYPNRIEFARWFLQQNALNPHFGRTVLFTDECTFTREGTFNTHNAHVWADVNPHATYPHAHQRRFSINVWAGILGDHLIGPYLLPERLNGKTYLTFLQHVLPDLLNVVPPRIRRVMWFQHDGAPAHYVRDVRNYLDITFPNRWIGRGGPVAWPARSPDLSPLDFFFWGRLKALMYETPIESPEELVARLSAAVGEVLEKPDVFANVRRSILRRCSACITSGGHNFEHLL